MSSCDHPPANRLAMQKLRVRRVGFQRVTKGATFVVLDVSRFLPLDEFRTRVDQLIADVHASELAPGTERIYVPGEIEADRREQRRRDGIPLPNSLVTELDEMAAALG